jgi:hypothetical protein
MSKYTTRGAGREATIHAIQSRKPFRTNGALHADTFSSDGAGKLHPGGRDYAEYCEAVDEIDYFVLSYSTPIAWHVTDSTGKNNWYPETGGWYIVGSTFSQTTGRHQSLVRSAIRGSDEYIAAFLAAIPVVEV